MMQKTPYFSWKTGALAKGCELCVQGKKLVLFVTGLCSRYCYYCPISEKKWRKDLVYADEWKIKDARDVIKEAELMAAEGAGITGGDPLMKVDRTARYIRILKKRFGKKFHIHLYTPMELLNETNLSKLYKAGLDEIRIHPNLYNSALWSRIDLVTKYDWDIGVEIPALPGMKKQTLAMIEYFKDKVKFMNLNELEISDTNAQHLVSRKYSPKNSSSYGVKGSEELAKFVLKKYQGKINMHYCTTRLKDRVQLANRIKRRARNVAREYDVVTKEGMLIRGAIYLKNLAPSFDYEKRLAEANGKKTIARLRKIRTKIQKEYRVNGDLISVDSQKLRLLTSVDVADKLKNDLKKMNLLPAIVQEYPTWDQLPVEIDIL